MKASELRAGRTFGVTFGRVARGDLTPGLPQIRA